jgi:hypothetical protein
MRVEMTHEYPVPLKRAYDYLMDVKSIPQWRNSLIEVINPERTSWHAPGDRMRVAYMVLGRRVEAECTLEENREAELVRFTTRAPGLPSVSECWEYTAKGDDACAVKVTQETEEGTSFFGSTIDRMLIPRVVEKDLNRTLDNLADIFSIGVPD